MFSEGLGISVHCIFRCRTQIKERGQGGASHEGRTGHNGQALGKREAGRGAEMLKLVIKGQRSQGKGRRLRMFLELCTYAPLQHPDVYIV